MDHTEATAEKLVERYVLNELPDEQAERFEDHFFDCAECASDIRTSMVLMRAGREVAAEPIRQAAPSNVVPISTAARFRNWTAVAAAAALALVLGVPMFRAPAATVGIARQVELGVSESRAEADVPAVVVGKHGDALVWVHIESHPDAKAYDLTVRRTDRDDLIGSVRLTPEQANEPQPLSLHNLRAGTYEVVTTRIGPDDRRVVAATKTFRVTR